MVRLANVIAVTTSIVVPTSAYIVLLNRRLERRIPLVPAERLPETLTREVTIPGKPKMNYVEGYYADLPASKWAHKETSTFVEDVARTFWTTLLMQAEWNVMSFFQTVGVVDEKHRIDPSKADAPPFTKGKPIMDGIFIVEKGVEQPKDEEILFSYWTDKYSSQLLGGVHGLKCEPRDNGKTIRVWFVTHLAINAPAEKLVASEASRHKPRNKYLGYDPDIVDANKPDEPLLPTSFSVLLWFHRLYSRMLVDFTAREIMFRK